MRTHTRARGTRTYECVDFECVDFELFLHLCRHAAGGCAMLPKQSNLPYHNQNIHENAKPKKISVNPIFTQLTKT